VWDLLLTRSADGTSFFCAGAAAGTVVFYCGLLPLRCCTSGELLLMR